MCRYCEYNETKNGENEFFWTNMIKVTGKFGLLDLNYNVDLDVNDDNKGHISLSVDVADELVTEKSIRIQYCPFCGKKFN